MEKRIKAYEKFIQNEIKKDLTTSEREKLIELHKNTLSNFQHERLIHLIITLFFIFITITFLLITTYLALTYDAALEFIPLYILVTLLTILNIFYVKHYYFLENHIQKLYDLSPNLFIF